MALLTGCHSPDRPIFEPLSAPITWPPPPQSARITYVGQLKTSDDLKAQRGGLDAIGQFFVGKKEPSPLYGPRSVVCTPDGGRVWVADPGGRCLHCFDLRRRTYRRVDRAGGERLLTPVGVCAGPEGSIFVCDSERIAVLRLDDRDGRLLDAVPLPDEVIRPVAAYYDAERAELYVVDTLAHDVKVFDHAGRLSRALGRRGDHPGEFNYPTAIAADGRRLWIADSGNHRVQAISREGTPLTAFGRAGDQPGDLALPKSLTLDPDGNLYVVDGRFENIQIFDDQGRLLLYFGEEGSGPGQFWLPGGIFIEPGGRIWVCDSYNRRLQVFQYLTETDRVP